MKKTLLCIGLLCMIIACKEAPKKATTKTEEAATTITVPSKVTPGNFVHSVFFWLKRPTNEADRTAFLASLRTFIDQSPNITTKHIGVPAATNREVIDNTYTFSLLLSFKDKAAQDNYQEEVAHKQFIAESSTLWEKVLVYDSEMLNP